jgi:hypothetical protein
MSQASNQSLLGIFTDIFKDIIFFPFWWYSLGLIKTAKKLANFVSDKEKSLALFVWVKNIFVPMYGQRDIQGFIISFFIRLVQIIVRGFLLTFWTGGAVIIFLVWIALPLIVVYEIAGQLF